MGIKVISLFDGMSCGYMALKEMGIEIDEYHAFENDKYAIQASNVVSEGKIVHHGEISPDTDFTQFKDFDLMLAGFPCQAFSLAGKGLAFDDPRGLLFFQMIRARSEISPKKFLFENVVMKKEVIKPIDDLIGVKPTLINSALLGAQNRKRNYWCNWDVEQPEDKENYWGDVREYGVDTECFYYTKKAMQWLGRVSQRKGKTLRVHQEKDKMQMIEASHYKKYSNQRFFGIVDTPRNMQCVAAMRGRYLINGKRQDGKQKTKGQTKQYVEFRYDGKTNCLTTVQKDNIVVPFTLPNRVPVGEFFFRYITVRECMRLQNIPEYIIDKLLKSGISNTQLYKLVGNGRDLLTIQHVLGGAEL